MKASNNGGSSFTSNPRSSQLSLRHRLHDEIVAYTGFVSATPYEVQARGLVLHALEATAKHVFGIASVSLFGSVATDIHLPDAFVSAPQM